jgi:hypothetical protein
MSPEQFWTSQDGQILMVRPNDGPEVLLTLAFWPRNAAEFEFLKQHLNELHFTERSTLARIGIEMNVLGKPTVDGNRLVLEASAFLYDTTFPNVAYWKSSCAPACRSADFSTRRKPPSFRPRKFGRRFRPIC